MKQIKEFIEVYEIDGRVVLPSLRQVNNKLLRELSVVDKDTGETIIVIATQEVHGDYNEELDSWEEEFYSKY